MSTAGEDMSIKVYDLMGKLISQDENIIDVKFSVQYRLKEPTDYIFKS